MVHEFQPESWYVPNCMEYAHAMLSVNASALHAFAKDKIAFFKKTFVV